VTKHTDRVISDPVFSYIKINNSMHNVLIFSSGNKPAVAAGIRPDDRYVLLHVIIGVLICMAMLLPLQGRTQEQRSPSSRATDHYLRLEYAKAAPLYEKLASRKKADVGVLEKLADCYRQMNEYDKAATSYAKIIAMPGAAAENWLYYGDMLKSQGKYAEAKDVYRQYVEKGGQLAINRLAGCDSALGWVNQPNPYRIDNLKEVNTGLSDWGGTLYPGNTLVYTSDSLRYTVLDPKAKINPKNYGRTNAAYQKLYIVDTVAHHPGVNFIHGFAPAMNLYQYHIGPVAFSARYDTAYFTVTNPAKLDKSEKLFNKKENNVVYYGVRRLELFVSTRGANGQWQSPVPFAYNKPTAYSVGHAALSKDGRLLYFVSDMPGGEGKTDIWYCERQEDGSWAAPKNCGPFINTADEEEFPTVGDDGVLYYSSKGLVGMGGFDLFRATGEKDKWERPVNLRYPLNSPADDFYYTVSPDGTSGYFSSNRQGGMGDDDIYHFTVSRYASVPGKTSVAARILMLETTVLDKEKKTPVDNALIFLLNKRRNDLWSQRTMGDGKSYNVLEREDDYVISAEKDGMGKSAEEKLSTKGTLPADTMRVVLYLDKLSGNYSEPVVVVPPAGKTTSGNSGETLALHSLYYDFNKWNIRPDAAAVLDEVAAFLAKHPNAVVELSSHTDSRGSQTYNKILSDKRSHAAVAYLMAKGIARKRLIVHAYGETRPANGCTDDVDCTEAEYQANRRTEVKIVRE
jgi:outer membrane protein OmpA-like peptidoglycan-associated protein/tetratricopeptide (TPR) repeat protein